MNFEVIATSFFQKQAAALDSNSKRILREKILLIKKNPFRYKRVRSKHFSRAHRVWLTIEHRTTRLVYAIIGNKVYLACLLDRGRDYQELEKRLKSLRDGL